MEDQLRFVDHVRADGLTDLPDGPGVYVVHRGVSRDDGSFRARELLYIGQAHSLAQRLTRSHEGWRDWERALERGEALYVSYARVRGSDLDRVEHALIRAHDPRCNETLRDTFPYRTTRVVATGDRGLIRGTFTVHPK